MQKSMEHRVVREVMPRRPKTVGPKTDVQTLKAMIARYEFNAFPVVDEQQILVGVVTRLDFLRMFRPDEAHRWIPDLRTLGAERVEDIMFFFQAEDGIRDGHVTGVQTCALPI